PTPTKRRMEMKLCSKEKTVGLFLVLLGLFSTYQGASFAGYTCSNACRERTGFYWAGMPPGVPPCRLYKDATCLMCVQGLCAEYDLSKPGDCLNTNTDLLFWDNVSCNAICGIPASGAVEAHVYSSPSGDPKPTNVKVSTCQVKGSQ